MRRRSTYVLPQASTFNPSEVQVSATRLSYPGLDAAREERLTFGLNDLPEELRQVLRESHELHLRWASEWSYAQKAPFVSSLTPGLHVHYTPGSQEGTDLLCPALQKLFSAELKCQRPDVSFTRPVLVSERFASTAALQYYSLLPSLSNFVAYLQRHICKQSDVKCIHDVTLLNIADYLDLDYDSISHALTVTAYWSKPPAVLYDPVGEWTTYDHWNLDITTQQNDKVEVGILLNSEAPDKHELQMDGVLTVVGEDDKPSPTMFFFPSRHHPLLVDQALSQAYSVSFQQPTGLHPTLEIHFPSRNGIREPGNKPAASTCALHTYLTLPSVLFADEYAFLSNDPLFQDAHNIISLRSLSGERDLEAPDYVIDKWGSTLLLELRTPTPEAAQTTATTTDGSWNVTIPLHLRYLEPSDGGITSVRIPWPIVFWACTAEEGTRFPVNPFDRTNLGYDGSFGTRTMFYHLQPRQNSSTSGAATKLVETINVPVLNPVSVSDRTVELGTLFVILSGFAWVLIKLWPGLVKQLGNAGRSQGVRKDETAVAKKQR